MGDFVHLHLHTNYSVLDGAIKISELAKKLKHFDMKSCAVTDHGSMFGVVKFYKDLKKAGIKPIIGVEAYTTSGSRFERQSGKQGKQPDINHLILLCQDAEGYANVSKLVTLANTEGFYYKPRMDREILEKHNKGIIALSACLKGEIPELLLRGEDEKAYQMAKWFRDVFENRYYIEVQDNGIPEQYTANAKLIELAHKLEIPIVATNDCHYIEKKDAFVQEVLICISTKKTLQDEDRLKMSTDEFYVKSADEMKSGFFKNYPEAIKNSLEIADRCNFGFKSGKFYLPVIGQSEAESDKIISELSEKGLEAKNVPELKKEIYRHRLDFELGIIKKMGFSSYYLIVRDFIAWAKSNNIPVGPGRGSGAASLVAYALGITNLDPIEHELVFERFLNPERVSLPDFDIDLCARRRDEVISYVIQHYGESCSSQIATFGFLKAKSAIKDVGRVLGYAFKDTDIISKLVPNGPDITLSKALELEPQLKKMIEEKEDLKNLYDIALAIEGAVRNVGVHAGGVIISSIPIVELSPMFYANKGSISTQFDMKDVETIGLVKFDLLGIDTLTIIHDAETFIKKNIPEFDVEKIPLKDPAVFQLLTRGDTIGVFQLESSGMCKLLREIKPDCFDDITAINALYRPGPLKGGMVDEFIARKHGRQKVEYQFPELESILKDTYGIIVYQEQVQRIASALAGYTLGEADLLRRAMGKKIPAEMAAQKERFLKGAAANAYDIKKAEDLFNLMEKFAEYGFNKAHAAVYALNAYRTAYLKCHFPVEFMSSLMTSKMGKKGKQGGDDDAKEPLAICISDAVSRGIKVLPPDINESVFTFVPRGANIVFGLGGLKNLGEAVIENILEERAKDGPFKGFMDFCVRVDLRKVNKKVLEQLIKSGAFDNFGIDRGVLFANMDKAIDIAISKKREKESGQFSLFEEETSDVTDRCIDLSFQKWDDATRLSNELDVTGFYLSGHPMGLFQDLLKNADAPDIKSLEQVPSGSQVNIGGILSLKREIVTKKGNLMGVFSLFDRTGEIEIIAFSEIYQNIKANKFTAATPVLVSGRYDEEEGRVKIVASGVKTLEESSFKLFIKADGQKLQKQSLDNFFSIIGKSRGRIFLVLELNFQEEGTVRLDIGRTNFDAAKMIFQKCDKEVGIKWQLV